MKTQELVGLIEVGARDKNGSPTSINLRTDSGRTFLIDRVGAGLDLIPHVGWRVKVRAISNWEHGIQVLEVAEYQLL